MKLNKKTCEQEYGNETFLGADAECFCKCAGDTPWEKLVRGCLIKANREIKAKRTTMSYSDAHDLCYSAADTKFPGKRPLKTITKCAVKCWMVAFEKLKERRRLAAFFASVRKGSKRIERGQAQRSRHQTWAGMGGMK